MVTTRSIRDDITNILDYLLDAEIALYTTTVSVTSSRVSFHSFVPGMFLLHHGDLSLDQYLSWVERGAYSALLYDGSLLQITYDIDSPSVVGHRLAYVPCPYRIDPQLLNCGEPVADIVRLHSDEHILLRSPIRFDFDPKSSKPGHPASHLTINSVDCRIACVAPLHVMRFVDFVFRNFYPDIWRLHTSFFDDAPSRHLDRGSLRDDEMVVPHIMWSQDAQHFRSIY
jgi:hypothetical protein